MVTLIQRNPYHNSWMKFVVDFYLKPHIELNQLDVYSLTNNFPNYAHISVRRNASREVEGDLAHT